MAGSSGTKRDAFRNTVATPVAGSGLEAFSRYRAEAAWHRRSFERAREPLLSDPAVPLVLDGIAVATADVTHVPIGRIKTNLSQW